MLTKDEVISIFEETKVLRWGHFLLTSGLHSDNYMQCAQILQFPHYTEMLCRDIAEYFSGDGVETVIGPALGGITIAYEVARHLNARALFTERENGAMALRRGFSIAPGERVLIVEDVITTGGSVREVQKVVEDAGGIVVGVGTFVDRTAGEIQFGIKQISLFSQKLGAYSPEECPLCKQGIPIEKPGSRK